MEKKVLRCSTKVQICSHWIWQRITSIVKVVLPVQEFVDFEKRYYSNLGGDVVSAALRQCCTGAPCISPWRACKFYIQIRGLRCQFLAIDFYWCRIKLFMVLIVTDASRILKFWNNDRYLFYVTRSELKTSTGHYFITSKFYSRQWE
jgi:hypothetical protein